MALYIFYLHMFSDASELLANINDTVHSQQAYKTTTETYKPTKVIMRIACLYCVVQIEFLVK